MSYRKACLVVLLISSTAALAQISHSEQVQISPPLVRAIDPPAPDATAADLELQGDRLRGEKLYLDALDYYHAALNKKSGDARLLNKIGITELMMQRYKKRANRSSAPSGPIASSPTPITIWGLFSMRAGSTARPSSSMKRQFRSTTVQRRSSAIWERHIFRNALSSRR